MPGALTPADEPHDLTHLDPDGPTTLPRQRSAQRHWDRLRRSLGDRIAGPAAADSPDEGLGDEETARILDVVARLGEGLLSCGAPTADVTTTSLRVAHSLGATRAQVDVTHTAVTVAAPSAAQTELTVLRVVRARATDYTRLAALVDTAREVVEEGLAVDEAGTRVKRAASTRRPYRARIASLGNVGLATAVSVIIGGGWAVALAAALTTLVVDQLVRRLARRDLPTFFQQFIGAGTATSLAILSSHAIDHAPGWFTDRAGDLPVSLVVSAGIVVLIPGLTLVTAAEDAISGYSQTAVVRGFEALLLTTGLVVGIAAALDVARRVDLGVALTFGQGSNPVVVQALAAATISACFAVANYSTRRTVLLAATVGVLGWVVRRLGDLALPPTAAIVVAALVIGFTSETIAPRLRVPTVVVSIAAILPLFPALDVYRAVYTVAEVSIDAGTALLVAALGATLALAAGVGFGEFFAASARGAQDRATHWVRRQAATRR